MPFTILPFRLSVLYHSILLDNFHRTAFERDTIYILRYCWKNFKFDTKATILLIIDTVNAVSLAVLPDLYNFRDSTWIVDS